MTSASSRGYALGASDAERARLIVQHDIYRGEAASLAEHVGLGRGSRAVDVGCGPLGVLDLFSELVGSSGRVVGLDSEPRMLDMARTTLAERDVTGVELVHGDLLDDDLEAESFDLAHERFLITNLPNPRGIVSSMTRLTKPGGYVALEDIDCISWICHPPHPSWGRLSAALLTAWYAAGLDAYVGRKLPGLLREAGLVDIGLDAHVNVWMPGDRYHKTLPHFVREFRERILQLSDLTEQEFDRCLNELEEHLEQPTTFTLYNTLMQAWGRKPG